MTQLRQKMLEELQRLNYSHRTAKTYIRIVRDFAAYFHRPPDKLGPEQIRQYQAYLFQSKKLSTATVSQYVSAIRFLFVKTLRRHFLTEHIPFPKSPRRLPIVLSPEEVARLIDAARNLYHRTLLMTLYSTAVRRSELCRLQVSDIDSQRMMIRIHGKGRRDRDVPLSPKLLETLRLYWRWRKPKTYLFPGRSRRADVPISANTVWLTCRQAAQQAGIGKRLSPHSLRHSCATHLLDAGADLRTIQVWLGHSRLEHTLIYLHLSNRHLQAVPNPLDSLQLSSVADDVEPSPRLQKKMTRPPLEVADIVRAQGNRFIRTSCRWIHWSHRKVLLAIARCRTAALGGHRDLCPRCGYRAISFNSCRNRHCPKCQSGARDRWIAARRSELLPVPYIHVVFTVPHHLAHLALVNKKVFYDLLFHATAETLLEIAADPKHLGAQIGFFAVLHSWGQNLLFHPHLHCLIPAGGLSLDHTRWIHPRYPFFLPVGVLSRVFRGKFVAALKRRFQQRQLIFPGSLRPLQNEKAFRAFLRPLFRQNWVVYAKPPFGGPHHLLGYLARYTHRVAITNHRLVAFTNHQVTFRWKDYAHGNHKRMMTLDASEFLRRFLLHVLPRGFVRIRSFGFLANRRRAALLPLCQRLLLDHPQPTPSPSNLPHPPACFRCPQCGTPMLRVESLSAWDAAQLLQQRIRLDSS